jgi:hypothetical protein
MAKHEIRKPIEDNSKYKGKYQRLDGSKFDVIFAQKEGLQIAEESNGLKNRLFIPITAEELETKLKDKLIIKI